MCLCNSDLRALHAEQLTSYNTQVHGHKYIMKEEIISLTKKFIAIPSNPDNKEALSAILELALSYLSEYTIERFEQNGTKSALVYNGEKRPEKFNVLLNAHLDVIPGKSHQYVPEIKDNKLYGVGAMDMKANTACLIFAFKEIAKKAPYTLGLQLTTDEEIGGFEGTKYQIEQGVQADFIIAGEPTNFDIVHKAKGILQMKIHAKGETAHGAYPWRGKNAIWEMHEFLVSLKKAFPTPQKETWTTTVNVSHIDAYNPVFNKVPDTSTIWLDIRFVPEDTETIESKIRSLLPSEFTYEIMTHEPALFTREVNPYIQSLMKSAKTILGKNITLRGANGSSDARHYTHINGAGIEFGPIGEGIGSDQEYVDISSLDVYYSILKSFLSNPHKNK